MQIDKNIPIPKVNYRHSGRVKNGESRKLLGKLEIGDSLFFKGESAAIIRGRYENVALRLDIKVATRQVEGGSRLWRVE